MVQSLDHEGKAERVLYKTDGIILPQQNTLWEWIIAYELKMVMKM